jgi:hypothetical protein
MSRILACIIVSVMLCQWATAGTVTHGHGAAAKATGGVCRSGHGCK